MSLLGYINLASNAGDTFTNAADSDMLIYTQSNSQKILLGATTNTTPTLTITSNMAQFSGNIAINNALAIKGLQITVNDGSTMNVTQTSVGGLSNDNLGQVLYIASNTSNNYFKFVASNTEIARLTGNGFIGIGTSNPLNTLHVNGSTLITNPTVYNTASIGWYNIGYWDCSIAQNAGAKLVLKIIGNSLYTGGNVSGTMCGGQTNIYLNNLNNGVTSTVNVDGMWKHEGGTPPFSSIKVVQNGANRYQYYIYAYVNSYTQHSINAETTQATVFTPSFTSVADPGANSATVQLIPMSVAIVGTSVGIGASNPVFGTLQVGNIVTSPFINWLNWWNSANIGTSGHSVTIATTDTNTTRPQTVGLCLTNESTANNVWSPCLSFGKRSPTTSYIGEPVILSAYHYQTTNTDWMGGDLCIFTRSNAGDVSERMRISGNGAVNIWSGTRWAVPNGYMGSGSLTIGDATKNYGGGSSWSADTAGLMLECLNNTEICVHDFGDRLASLMYYEGSTTNRITIGRGIGVAASAVSIPGTLSKGGGSFDIEHPDPAKKSQGYRLRHCFVESPTRGDNIYRYVVETVNKKALVTLPSYFKHLNENPQVWVSAKNVLGYGMGIVNNDLTTVDITVNEDGEYNVMVVATRKDKLMVDYFDEKGVEYIST